MRLFLCLAIWGLAAAQADQNDPLLDDLFAQLRAGSGDAASITEEIEALWVRAPEVSIQILVDRTLVALARDELDVAAVLADHITGLAPSYAEGWVLRGHLAFKSDNLTQAEASFRKAVALEPRHFVALEALGDIASAAGDKDDAFQLYRKALDVNPHEETLREKADQLRFELAGQEI